LITLVIKHLPLPNSNTTPRFLIPINLFSGHFMLRYFNLLPCIVSPRNPFVRGRISTVDLLVLIFADQLVFILKLYFLYFFTKQPLLIRRSTVLTHWAFTFSKGSPVSQDQIANGVTLWARSEWLALISQTSRGLLSNL